VRETAADLERPQRLLDQSVEQASSFLRSSFQMPERSLSAEQLVARHQSPREWQGHAVYLQLVADPPLHLPCAR